MDIIEQVKQETSHISQTKALLFSKYPCIQLQGPGEGKVKI